jgi:hypothetical protein
MITFVKQSDLPRPVSRETEEYRFERIRKAASERHRKSDTDGTRPGRSRRPRTIRTL